MDLQLAPRVPYAVRGHLRKLFIYDKNYTISKAVRCTTELIFTLGGTKQAAITGVALS